MSRLYEILVLLFFSTETFSFDVTRRIDRSTSTIYSNELSHHTFRLARSSDKNSQVVRGILTFPNGTLLHANRLVPKQSTLDGDLPTAMLTDLLQLPQLSKQYLGPIRFGRGQNEPEDRLLRAVVILPDGRRFRGFRSYTKKDDHHSRYIKRGNIGAFIYDNDVPSDVSTNKIREVKEDPTNRDSFYLRKGELGAYIYGSSQKRMDSKSQCTMKQNIEKGKKRRYLVLHQEPCELNEQHKLWKLKDGREIVYFGEPEFVSI